MTRPLRNGVGIRVQFQAICKRLLILAAFVSGTSAAHAQTRPGSLERTVPKFEALPTRNQPRVETPIVPAQSEVSIAGTFVLSAVNIEGATVFNSSQLAQAFEPYLASQVGQAELNKIVAAISERYRREGYLLSYATLPAQSVQSGIVRIRVVEGYIDQVRLKVAHLQLGPHAQSPSASGPSDRCVMRHLSARSAWCARPQESSWATYASVARPKTLPATN